MGSLNFSCHMLGRAYNYDSSRIFSQLFCNSELEVELVSESELPDYSFGRAHLLCVTLCGKFLQMFRDVMVVGRLRLCPVAIFSATQSNGLAT